MKKLLFIFIGALLTCPSFADEAELDAVLLRVRQNCSGIASEFNKMKTMAGINTAVTGVGTLAGGGAIATGFIKQSKDAEAEQIEIRLDELRKIESRRSDNPAITAEQLQRFESDFDEYLSTAKAEIEKTEAELNKLTQQSKNLGNWRTGLLAGNTATNVAGAIIAGNNKASTDLKGAIEDCKASLKDLPRVRMQARMDGPSSQSDAAASAHNEKLAIAEQIISECGAWEYTDVSKIDNRANAAMWSSIAGAGLGAAGTVTSAVANTDKTRNNNTDSGKQNEKNLNIASNILAIGATAGSVTATIFNSTQIAAIKKASKVADNCEEALQ